MTEWLGEWFTVKELLWIILTVVLYGFWHINKLVLAFARDMSEAMEKLSELEEKMELSDFSRELERPDKEWGEL